jgi:TatD DNase family protein
LAQPLDIHTHIDQYTDTELPGVIERAWDAGVGAIIAAGVTLASSARCVQLARQYETVFAGAGVHPEDMTGALTPGDLDQLRRIAADPRVVVMSEIGLDHTPPERFRPTPGSAWQPSTGPEWHPIQEAAFRAQIGIAREQGLTVVFHNRLATKDTLRVLKEEHIGELGGAAHYFQGDWAYAKALLDLGVCISLAKPLLRNPELQEVARKLPLDSIVLETDASPQPYKGDRSKWTEPRDIPVIAAKLAELRRTTIDEVCDQTTANALRVMGKRGEPVRAAAAGEAPRRRLHSQGERTREA